MNCETDQKNCPNVHPHVAAGTATQPQRFVLAESDSQEAITSAWIATPEPVEVEP